MKRLVTLTLAASILLTFGAIARAHTRHHTKHHYKHHYSKTYSAKRHAYKEKIDANGNPALAIVRTTNGLTSKVVASARDKFQGFIDAIEAAGYRIRDFGCYSSGHMPGSKHHWGGACDFDQKRRNVTAKFMYHVTTIAHQFGLVDGCEWHYRDCGHIEVPGANSVRVNSFALAMR